MKKAGFITLFTFSLLLSACMEKPEGPAGEIGKGLDQILDGTQELGDKYGADSQTVEQVPTKEEKRRRSEDPRHDLKSDDWWREHDRQMQQGE